MKFVPKPMASTEGLFGGPSAPDVRDILKYIQAIAKGGKFDFVQVCLWQPLAWCAGLDVAGFKAGEDKGLLIKSYPEGLFTACWNYAMDYRAFNKRDKWNLLFFQYDVIANKFGYFTDYDENADGLPKSNSSASHSKPGMALDNTASKRSPDEAVKRSAKEPTWLP